MEQTQGIGKPEPLIGNLSGWWSRRIDGAHRIGCRVENDTVIVFQCRSRYGS
ncbi:MAG: type II toxin-antitoxin system YoeB family toxin [Spirochaetaceae bacterium]|nr:type II toxin-antitoxin system YoeB family toxin [Spirochaetaceae bacterium]